MEEDCFHLGVKALIRNREGKVLLLERERASKETYWDMPGGRLKKGETLVEALVREIEEEVGLKHMTGATLLCTHPTSIRIRRPGIDVGLIISIYILDTLSDFTPQLSQEHIRFGWFEMQEAITHMETQFPARLIHDIRT